MSKINKVQKQATGSIAHCLSDHFKNHVLWLIEQRDKLDKSSRHRFEINLNIILNSAIYLEGALGEGLQNIARYLAVVSSSGALDDRFHAKLKLEIQNCTGLEKYSELYFMTIGKKLSELVNGNDFWEGTGVLFGLRNPLAHSKTFSTAMFMNAGSHLNDIQQESYLKACRYLFKKQLIAKNTPKAQFHMKDIITDKIADWAFLQAEKTIERVASSLPKVEATYFNFGRK